MQQAHKKHRTPPMTTMNSSIVGENTYGRAWESWCQGVLTSLEILVMAREKVWESGEFGTLWSKVRNRVWELGISGQGDGVNNCDIEECAFSKQHCWRTILANICLGTLLHVVWNHENGITQHVLHLLLHIILELC